MSDLTQEQVKLALALEPVANQLGIRKESLAQALEPWLIEFRQEVLTDALHPEFGYEWDGPNGLLLTTYEAGRATGRHEATHGPVAKIPPNPGVYSKKTKYQPRHVGNTYG